MHLAVRHAQRQALRRPILHRRANHFALSEAIRPRCQAPRAKIFCFRFSEKYGCLYASRLAKRGVRPSSPDARRECDGRGWCARRTLQCRGRRNRVVPIPRSCPEAGIKPCETFREATVAKEQGTPRRSRISVNTIAQGTPDCFGCPVVACVRKMHISLHARPAGAASIRCSLRPRDFRGPSFSQSSGTSCRGNAKPRLAVA
jgi:hypothetical protein